MEYFYSLPEHPVISVASSTTPTKNLSSKTNPLIQEKETKSKTSSPTCLTFWSTWPQKIKLFVDWWKGKGN